MTELAIEAQHAAIVRTILQTYVYDFAVWVFGSRATGLVKPFSDLDLVIMTKAPLPASRLADLREAFDDSDLPYRVDIVDWASTSAEFQEIIRASAVEFYPGSSSEAPRANEAR